MSGSSAGDGSVTAGAGPDDAPTDLFARWIVLGFIFGYAVVFLFFKTSLPEKWVTDSDKIAGMMAAGGGADSVDNSFAATAFFFLLIGEQNVEIFSFLVGFTYLALAFRGSRWFGTEFLVRMLWVVPCIPLNLFVASKETIVILMTLVIVATWLVSKSNKWTFGTILVCYAAYGGLVRIYYLVILLVWVYLLVLYRLRGPVRVLWLILPLAAVFAAPNSLLEKMQSQRDTSNAYAVLKGSDIRTAFNNWVPPKDSISFLMNYVYAAAIFVVPFLFFLSVKELVLFACVMSQGWFIWRCNSERTRLDDKERTTVQLFTALLLGHFLTQVIFEPDLGSFIRHLSSASLYMLPLHLTTLGKRS
jgi:hypothetical protein